LWSGKTEYGSGLAQVGADYSHHMTYSANFTGIDATDDGAYFYKSLQSYSEYYMRAHIRLGALPPVGQNCTFAPMLGRASGAGQYYRLMLRNNTGTLQAGVQYYNNTVKTNYYWVNQAYAIDTWYCVELRVKCSNGDGVTEVWWGTTKIISLTTLINNDYNVSRAWIGVYHAYSSSYDTVATHYDCVVVDDIRVGMEATPLEDDFEDGTFNAWTGELEVGSGLITIASDQTHRGSYSAKATGIDHQNDCGLLYKDLEADLISDEYYLRAYWRISDLPPANKSVQIFARLKDQSLGHYLGELRLWNDDGTLKAGTQYWDNGTHKESYVAQSFSANMWYCFEVYVKCAETASSEDGIVRLYWEGNLIVNLTGLDNDGDIDRAYVGIGTYATGENYTLTGGWIDDVILSDHYVGTLNATVLFMNIKTTDGDPVDGAKVNGTDVGADGEFIQQDVVLEETYTFVVEPPASYYPAWIIYVSETFYWNGTHFILSHKISHVTEYLLIYFHYSSLPYVNQTNGDIGFTSVGIDEDTLFGDKYSFTITGSDWFTIHSAGYNEEPFLSSGNVASKTYNSTTQLCNITIAGDTTVVLLFDRPTPEWWGGWWFVGGGGSSGGFVLLILTKFNRFCKRNKKLVQIVILLWLIIFCMITIYLFKIGALKL